MSRQGSTYPTETVSSKQYTTISYLSVQQSKLSPTRCCGSASGNSASGHPQHRGGDSFDCCTERYEIVVLLPNSEDTCYWKYFLKFE